MLYKSLEAAAETQVAVQCIQKVSDDEKSLPYLQFVKQNQEFIDGLSTTCQVGGATSWFWARLDATGIVDVLFDEAAQMSLANVLAVSQAAQSIVLLGDPRQLEQPIQGSHPDVVAVSALDHILGEHATIEGCFGKRPGECTPISVRSRPNSSMTIASIRGPAWNGS
ncbi:DNA2/NAM7 family helicase [Bradyrhizobium japonicum]|uniref:DNA2/NAM7 family helicase n=1 Tax=Bradyrhizobium japonicum TaxID=375 RepID=UPI000462789D|nr:DNA2/NAM7 family helicase [Bradyrhizobium japonicum]